MYLYAAAARFAVSVFIVISLANYSIADVVEFFDHAQFDANTNSLTIVDFDSTAKQTQLTGTEFAGMTIVSRRITVLDPQDFAPGLTIGGININSQPHGISASLFYSGSNIQFDEGDDNFTILLSNPQTSAGLWVGNLGANNNDPVTATVVSFFDTSGGLLAEESLTQAHPGLIGSGVNNRIFYGITSSNPIGSFSVANAASDGDGILLDDIQFGTAIPEPNSAIFLLTTLGCTALIGRRRKSNSNTIS